jgi:hypothetical protein
MKISNLFLFALITAANLLSSLGFAEETKGNATAIPGYSMGSHKLARSPVSLKDLESLKKTLLFTDDDIKALNKSKDILADQTDAILDVWYGFVASMPELVYFFKNNKTGKPDGDYLAAVRKRFGQWILDTADANYDQTWLDYQYEIGLRHAPAKKNKTDKANSVKFVNFRYLPALTIPVTTTLKPFLAKKGAKPDDVEKMYQAWVKSVLLQSILWSEPFIKNGQF